MDVHCRYRNETVWMYSVNIVIERCMYVQCSYIENKV